MAWFILLIAGLSEVAWAVGLKYSEGLTKPIPAAFTIISLVISFVLLGIALRTLPLGTAYGVWVGIGAVGTAIAGMYFFAEPISTLKLVSLVLIIVGIAGLKLSA
ncbi:MAG: DMT family transporter [Vibrio sp.]